MVVCVYPLLGKAPDPWLAFRKPTCPRRCQLHCHRFRLAACSRCSLVGHTAIDDSTARPPSPPSTNERGRRHPSAVGCCGIHPAPSSAAPRPPSLALDSCAVLTLSVLSSSFPPHPHPQAETVCWLSQSTIAPPALQLPPSSIRFPVSISQSRAGDSSRFCRETLAAACPWFPAPSWGPEA